MRRWLSKAKVVSLRIKKFIRQLTLNVNMGARHAEVLHRIRLVDGKMEPAVQAYSTVNVFPRPDTQSRRQIARRFPNTGSGSMAG